MKFQDENIAYLQRKLSLFIFVVGLFLLIVLLRLFYLQILSQDHYVKLATEIFIREEEVVAQRGKITDRNGAVLADTRTYFEIVVIPQYVADQNALLDKLTKLLPVKKEVIEKSLFEARFEPKFMPVVLVEDVSYDWIARIKEHQHDLPGVEIRAIPVRQYLYPEMFSHALGYLREIDRQNLNKAKEEYPGVFSLGDLMGAAGLEKAYDIALKGKDGQMGKVVDARGREVVYTEDLKILKNRVTELPVPGYTLKSTIDFEAQKVASDLFQGKKGSVVALDPHTGEVLVLYSSPGFDANRLTKAIDKDYWSHVNLHPDKILFNRAIQALYPPASTYKIVALTAGLETGVIHPQKTAFQCGGGLQFGNRFFKCWNHGGHGRVDAVRGLAQSCDVFFYRLGLLVGVDRLAETAHLFGLGQKVGIEIPFEQPGLIPTRAWKKQRYKQDWIESETLSIAIGQGYDLVTPLQNAAVVSMVANGGYRIQPHLGKALLRDGQVIQKIEMQKIPTPLVKGASLKWVQKGMIEVVHGQGTAVRLRQSPFKIAGKTGTAQVVSHGTAVKKGKNVEAHALFVGYAPYDDPKIAVSVVVEHGRGGSAAAAPIAMAVIDAYLGDRR